jgi:hypothetical protein
MLIKSVRGECFPFVPLDTPRDAQHSRRTENVSNSSFGFNQRFPEQSPSACVAYICKERSPHLYRIDTGFVETGLPAKWVLDASVQKGYHFATILEVARLPCPAC